MPDGTEQVQDPLVQVQGNPASLPSGSAPLGATPGATPAAQRAGPQVVTENTLKQIKETAARRGAEEAISALLGVSPEEAKDAFARLRSGGQQAAPVRTSGNVTRVQAAPERHTPKPQPPSKRDGQKAWNRYERDLAQWKARDAQATSRIRQEIDKRQQAVAERNALDAENALMRIAFRAGIKDDDALDFAISQYQKKLAGMADATQEELAKLDHVKFFTEELKARAPWLYSNGQTEVVKPATTGTGVGAAAAADPAAKPPAPGASTQAGVQAGKVDVRKMKPDEFKAYLASKGLGGHAMGR